MSDYLLEFPSRGMCYAYTYDDNGNITAIYEAAGSSKSILIPGTDNYCIVQYTYDSANQLIGETNYNGGPSHTWTYDDAGNILSRTEYAYTTGELGDPVDTVTYCYYTQEWGDLLSMYDGKYIIHDTVGNLTSDGTWTYTWEHGRELATMSDGTTTWTYTYDANGMRTSRTDGTTTYEYVYSGSQLVQMTVGNNTLFFVYDATGAPVLLVWNGTPYYYITNIQGDVIVIMDLDGEIVVDYDYDAWGNLLEVGESMADTLGALNPLTYRGYVYDRETGLYYLQSRYYNPEWGRFINADGYVSTGQGFVGNNMFAYCYNNPIKYSDYSGNIPIIAILVGIGVTIVGALLAPSRDEVNASAENHYSRNDLNAASGSIEEILDTYDKQPEWADAYHEDTSGKQGADAIYNDKYLSPNGGHYEVIICSPPGKKPYIVDETVDEKNMGTYNYASNTIPVVYHLWHFVADMVPYYLYGNTASDNEGLLKWVVK